MNMRLLPVVIVSLAIMVLASCGVYTFTPGGQSKIKTIAVERFENRTAEYGLEDVMTDQIIDAFIADGNLKVVSRENADAVLNGILTRYDRRAHDPDENDLVTSYAINMYFDITLTNPADNTEIWSEKLTQIGVYQLETQSEADGQQAAIGLLIEAIINKTTKSW
ncbi:MAG: LptE family protein [candidate division Zixibacteria bacterium]|nr:LptE family protein [candidate division Zixibacteria bacterium]